MKRFAAILLAAVLAFSLAPCALAAQYEDVNWLYADWELNGYPDDVGGVYSYDGDPTHLCILLVGDDGTREAEIRSTMVSAENVRFGSAEVPYKELLAISGEIAATYMNETYGVLSCGIEPDGTGERLVVNARINDDKYESTSELLTAKYGELISLTGGRNAAPDAAAGDDGAAGDAAGDAAMQPVRSKRDTIILIILYAAMTIAVCVFIVARRRKREKERKGE